MRSEGNAPGRFCADLASLAASADGFNATVAIRVNVFAEEILESDAACGKSIDVRRSDLAVSVASERPVSLIVGEDEDDIRISFH